MQGPSPRPNLVRGDQGPATGVAVVMVAALVAVTVGGAHVGATIVARHRAQASADLAALAAAAYLPAGSEMACTRASVLAREMRTVAVACTVDGLDVVIAVEASRTMGLAQLGPARAVARAGPATTDEARNN